jgi:N-acetylneuraminate synthase/N,N'-diacetyllegionaminate synthase
MVSLIRTVDHAMGDTKKILSLSEREIKKIARKSLVAARDIPPGTTISEDMISIKRPGTGIEPKYFGYIAGKRAKNQIKKDELFQWEMIE